MLGLNIKLHSFEFFGNLINANDNIRVSITTLPDGQKQAFTFNARKMSSSTANFTIKFNETIEKIIIVFRKQNLLSDDHIIASTVISSEEFSKLFPKIENISVHKLDIYEPIQNHKNNNMKNKTENRKVFGRMLAQFSLLEKFIREDIKYDNQQGKFNTKDTTRIDSILKDNNMLFQDLILN